MTTRKSAAAKMPLGSLFRSVSPLDTKRDFTRANLRVEETPLVRKLPNASSPNPDEKRAEGCGG
jgi:hypothetical protein